MKRSIDSWTDAVLGSFLLEPATDLLGRPSHRQPVTDGRPQRAPALDAGQPSAPRSGDPIRRGGFIAAPQQRMATQLPANRRGTPADLTTRCPGFIRSRHLNALVQVELIILRSHRNAGLYRRCTWRVNLGSLAS